MASPELGLRHCALGGALVRDAERIPPDLTERGLHELGVGCNRLRCPQCDEWVRRDPDNRYRCGCLVGYPEDVYLERQGNGVLDQAHLPWRCHGHPAPTPDERALHRVTDDLVADVARLLRDPPTHAHFPSAHAGYAADVRLDLDVADAAFETVVEALDSPDSGVVLRAMDLLRYRGKLPLAEAAERYKALTQLPDPEYPKQNLGSHWERHIVQLAYQAGVDSPAMEAAAAIFDVADPPSRRLRRLLSK